MKLTLAEIQNRTLKRSTMLIGPPKTGKTSALATIPDKYRPVWYFDFDGGDSAEPFIRRALANKWKLSDIVVHTYGRQTDRVSQSQYRARGKDVFLDFLKDFNGLFDLVDTRTGLFKSDVQAPGTIVLDSGSGLQLTIMDFVLSLEGHELGAKGTDARSDYGKQMGKLEEIIESGLSLPCNFVMIFHEQLEKDDLIGRISALPAVTGKLAPVIGKHFGAVLYSIVTKDDKKQDQYQWITKPDESVWIRSAGVRSRDDLPARMPQDFSQIWR